MPAVGCLNPTGGPKNNGLEVGSILKICSANGTFADAQPEQFSIPKRQTDNNWACQKAIVNHVPVVMQEDIHAEVAIWFHVVEEKYHEQVKVLIWIWENPDWE